MYSKAVTSLFCLMMCMAVVASQEEGIYVVMNPCLNKTTSRDRELCRHTELVEMETIKNELESQGKNVQVPDLCLSAHCFQTSDGTSTCKMGEETLSVDCECPSPGYLDVGVPHFIPGIYCEDVNECETRTAKCASIGSTCTNTEGSYRCTCDNGYHGDGFDCQLLFDECVMPGTPLDCHERATCTPIQAEVGCFALDSSPTMLTDDNMSPGLCIDYCKDNHPATSFAALRNKTACHCVMDIDHMSAELQPSECNAICAGSLREKCGGTDGRETVYHTGQLHSCDCKPGFEGDGVNQCADKDECLESPCGEHATCVNTVGSFMCVCRYGYIQSSDLACTLPEVKDCGEEKNKQFDKMELWHNCHHVYQVDCDYTGQAYMEHSDKLELSEPGPNGVCVGSILTSKFNPHDLTRSDLQDQQKLFRLRVTCGGTGAVVITIDRFVANAMGFHLGDMFLGPANEVYDSTLMYKNSLACHGRRWYADGALYRFELSGKDGESCGETIKYDPTDDTHTVAGAIHGRVGLKEELVSRQHDLYIAFTCSYSTKAKILQGDIHSYERHHREKRRLSSALLVNLGSEVASVISMRLWTSSSFDWPYQTAHVVDVPVTLYADVTVDRGSKWFRVQLMQCWADVVGDITKRKMLLMNGCDEKPKSDSGFEMLVNNQPTSARFAFKSFSFVGGVKEFLNIKCSVNLCDGPAAKCNQECDRKLTPVDDKMSMDEQTIVTEVGPLTVIDHCGPRYKGGCDHHCHLSEKRDAICSCHHMFDVDPNDPKKCQARVVNSALVITDDNGDLKWYFVVPGAIAIIFIVVAVAVLVRKRLSNAEEDRKYTFGQFGEGVSGEISAGSILR